MNHNPFQSIAPPRKLRVDQILTRSIIISWVTPSSDTLDFIIDEYRILVDSKLRTIVEGTQTNAVIENIERKQDKVYTIAVQAVASDGRLSLAEKCMIKWPDRNVIHLEDLGELKTGQTIQKSTKPGQQSKSIHKSENLMPNPWVQKTDQKFEQKIDQNYQKTDQINQKSTIKKAKQSITQNPDHIRIHFTPKNPDSTHNLFLNDEQIAHLSKTESSYELSFNGLESNKTHKWHIVEADNTDSKISVAAGEFTVKSSNDAPKPATHVRLSTIQEDSSMVVLRWIPGDSNTFPSYYSIKMIGPQTEQSVTLHDGKPFIPGDTCSAYLFIKELVHFDNHNCELVIRAYYDDGVEVDSINGVKVPDWLVYRALHSLPNSPKRLNDKLGKLSVSEKNLETRGRSRNRVNTSSSFQRSMSKSPYRQPYLSSRFTLARVMDTIPYEDDDVRSNASSGYRMYGQNILAYQGQYVSPPHQYIQSQNSPHLSQNSNLPQNNVHQFHQYTNSAATTPNQRNPIMPSKNHQYLTHGGQDFTSPNYLSRNSPVQPNLNPYNNPFVNSIASNRQNMQYKSSTLPRKSSNNHIADTGTGIYNSMRVIPHGHQQNSHNHQNLLSTHQNMINMTQNMNSSIQNLHTAQNCQTSQNTSQNIPNFQLQNSAQNIAQSGASKNVLQNSTLENPTLQHTQHSRSFVALYSYDPQTSSPNTYDMVQEELKLKEGEILKIIGDKDADGFYEAINSKGEHGLVPFNMVMELRGDAGPQMLELQKTFLNEFEILENNFLQIFYP